MRVWYCRRGDGESYGRVIELDMETLGDPESCPICEYPSEYHGCGKMELTPVVPDPPEMTEPLFTNTHGIW